MQKILSSEQVKAFYHDEFVADQVRDFVLLLGDKAKHTNVVDVGGGCGFFAQHLADLTGYKARVIDMDPASIAACQARGIDATLGDAIHPQITEQDDIVCFNLILHHLVADTDRNTLSLQKQALEVWHEHATGVFVNEYIYESYFDNASGWLIFQITKSKFLSAIGKLISKVVSSLKANTFGVGVRFRAHNEWHQVFEAAGFNVKAVAHGNAEPVTLARRLLLIRQIRRDSFLLEPKV
jgi:SAM-dependent methyltransferase